MNQFANGTITACPSQSSANTLGKAISYAIVMVSTAVAINIIGGVNIQFTQNNQSKWGFSFITTGVPKFDFKTTVQDSRGVQATVSGSYEQSSNDTTFYLLPDALVFNADIINQISGQIDMPSSTYDKLVEERMKHLRPTAELNLDLA
jgi:hypothetical protein